MNRLRQKGADVAVVGRIVGFDGLFGEVRTMRGAQTESQPLLADHNFFTLPKAP